MMSKELLWQSAENISTILAGIRAAQAVLFLPQFLWSWNVQVISISAAHIIKPQFVSCEFAAWNTHKKSLHAIISL